MKVTVVPTILVMAPWQGDPFWVSGQEFSRTASLFEVQTDAGVTGLGESIVEHA